jgi:two-component SAPR family response regulator
MPFINYLFYNYQKIHPMSNIKRIIIIDDDHIATIIGVHVIKRTFPDIDICSFTSPVEGLEFIQTEYITNPVKTLLFLDINMPMMSGWEVLNEMRYYETIIREHLFIYICSTSISYQDKILSSRHPLVNDFLEKPITKHKLIDIMRRERYNRKQYFTTFSSTENNF